MPYSTMPCHAMPVSSRAVQSPSPIYFKPLPLPRPLRNPPALPLPLRPTNFHPPNTNPTYYLLPHNTNTNSKEKVWFANIKSYADLLSLLHTSHNVSSFVSRTTWTRQDKTFRSSTLRPTKVPFLSHSIFHDQSPLLPGAFFRRLTLPKEEQDHLDQHRQQDNKTIYHRATRSLRLAAGAYTSATPVLPL
ncbi:hypothetical protein VTL71DRAFT_16225 [Oculimacula yallundae]|uniref:Uncharacterized protein n=1 Tax=Oculimacula yallundae TaxID=86028 RepID=A0ABR4CEK0_9HELO